jgi:hypothetical protein
MYLKISCAMITKLIIKNKYGIVYLTIFNIRIWRRKYHSLLCHALFSRSVNRANFLAQRPNLYSHY